MEGEKSKDALAQLSISLIVRDEEENLSVLFSSLEMLKDVLGPALEVVVLDTGSKDNTCKNAKDWGCQVFDFVWINDFAAARNKCLEKCTGKWIMWLDADDFLPPETVRNLIELIQNPVSYMQGGVLMPIAFVIRSGHEDGSASEFLQTRLFPNFKGIQFSYPIHESLGPALNKLGLTVIPTKWLIQHRGYEKEETLNHKNKRNLEILEQLRKTGAASKSHLYTLARIYHVSGQYQDALPLYQELAQEGWKEGQTGKALSDLALAAIIYGGQALGMMNFLEQAQRWFEAFWKAGSNNKQFVFEYAKAQIAWSRPQAKGVIKPSPDQSEAVQKVKSCKELLVRARELPRCNWSIPTQWEEIEKGIQYLIEELDGPEKSRQAASGLPEPLYESAGPLAPSQPNGLWANLTILTVVKNGGQDILNLAADLHTVQPEWIVLDTGSQDDTPQSLKALGWPVYTYKWTNDFSQARNYALSLATRPWVLWLDADDRLEEKSRTQITQLLTRIASPEYKGPRAFRFVVESPRENGSKEKALQIRLFERLPGVFWTGMVHESLAPQLRALGKGIVDTDIHIKHTGYYWEKDRKEKARRNLEMLRIEWLSHQASADTALHLGNSLYQLGQYQEAQEIYRKGREKQLSNQVPEACYSFLRRQAQCLYAQGFKQEAQALYKDAVVLDPTDVEGWYWLGKCQLDAADYTSALQSFLQGGKTHGQVEYQSGDSLTFRINCWGYYIVLGLKSNYPAANEESLREGALYLLERPWPPPFEPSVLAEYFESRRLMKYLDVYMEKWKEAEPDGAELRRWKNLQRKPV